LLAVILHPCDCKDAKQSEGTCLCTALFTCFVVYCVLWSHVCTFDSPTGWEKEGLLISCFLMPVQVLVIAVLLKIVMRRKFSIIQVTIIVTYIIYVLVFILLYFSRESLYIVSFLYIYIYMSHCPSDEYKCYS
jgi:hypothetical protein